LERQLENTREANTYERTLALITLDDGESVEEVAHRLRVSRATVYNWMERYRNRPKAEALESHWGPGRPRLWDKESLRLLHSLLKQSPQDYGYPSAHWTVPS